MKGLIRGILMVLVVVQAWAIQGAYAVDMLSSVKVTVSKNPASTNGNAKVYKGGDPLSFGLSGSHSGYTLSWRKVGKSEHLCAEATYALTKEEMMTFASGRYYCLLTNSSSVTYTTDTVEIKVIDTKVKIRGFGRICIGDANTYELAVSDNNSYTYAWHHGLGSSTVISSTASYSIASVRASDAGKYYCIVHDDTYNITFYSDTMDVLVSAYPQVGITVNGTATTATNKSFVYCYDQEVELVIQNKASGQPDARYLWTGSNLRGASGNATIHASVRGTATYRAMITNNGCVRDDTVRLSMVRLSLPENHYVVEGESVTVSPDIDVEGNYTYAWSNGSTTSNRENYTFTAPEGQTTVQLDVTPQSGLSCTNHAECSVFALPNRDYQQSVNDGYVVSRRKLDIIQGDTTFCARRPLTLDLAYTGYDGYTYEWMRINGSKVTPVDTCRTLRIESHEETSAVGVKYFCKAFDLEKGQYVYSDTVKVIVKYRPKAAIVDPDETTTQCGGYAVELTGKNTLESTEIPTTRYTWNGFGILSGQGTKKISAKMGTNGYYQLVMGVDVCYDTTEIYLPITVRTVNIASQLILPQAGQVQFVAERPEGGQLTWYPNGEVSRAVVTGDERTATLGIREGDENVVVKMDMDGCSFYDTCVVLIREFVPSADATAPDDGFALSYPSLRVTSKVPRVCIGRDIVLSVYNLGYDNYKYEWRKVGKPDQTHLSDNISYQILNADDSYKGLYYCVAIDPENPSVIVYSDTLELMVDQGPKAVIDRSIVQACYGETLTIHSNTLHSGSGAAFADEFLWTGEGIVGGQGTPDVRVKVGDRLHLTLRTSKTDGCWSEDTITIPVVHPQVTLEPRLVSLNEASSVQFTATTELPSLEWRRDGNSTVLGTEESISANFGESGYVTVTAKSVGCVGHDTAYVFVKRATSYHGGDNDGYTMSHSRPKIPGELVRIQACPDSLLTFRVVNAEPENFRYIWYKRVLGGDPVMVHEGAEYTFNVTRNDGGRYFCTASESDGTPDGTGVRNSDTLELTVMNGPIANIDASATEICIDGELTLDGRQSANGFTGSFDYAWAGEGVTEEQAGDSRIKVSPKNDATYTLRVSSENGCYDTATVSVKVNKPTIELPSNIQLYGPNLKYKVDAKITPADATVVWKFKERMSSQRYDADADGKFAVQNDGMAYVRVTDANNCVVNDSVYIRVRRMDAYHGGDDDGFSVLEVSTFIKLLPPGKDLTICRDNIDTLKAVVSGPGRYTYSWHRLEDNSLGYLGAELGNASALPIEYMSESKAGRYYCIIKDLDDLKYNETTRTNEPREYSTDTIQLILKNGPVAAVERKDGVSGWNTCLGSTIKLLGSATNADEFTDGNGLQYAWAGDNFEPLANPYAVDAHPVNDGLYIFTVTDPDGGCSDTIHVQFNITSPEVDLPDVVLLNKPGEVSITATANGEGDFAWYKNSYLGSPIATGNPGTFNVNADCKVIVAFRQGTCYGLDTTNVFMKAQQTFAGGEEDGYAGSDLELRISLAKKRLNVCRGWDIEIPTRTAELGRVLRYKWYKVGDAGRKVLGTNSTLVLPTQSMDDGGKFYCEVTDLSVKDNMGHAKTISTDTAYVTMVNGPLAEISTPTANRLKSNFCRGGEELISAEATENKKVNHSDTYIYEWFGEGITPMSRDYEISALLGNSGRYIVKATLGECYTYDTIDIKIYEPEVRVEPVIFLSKPDDVEVSVENPMNDPITWSVHYRGSEEMEAYSEAGNTLHYRMLDDGYAVVSRTEGGCVGHDTCRIFVKKVVTFEGGADDGFTSAGSGAYCKPLILTDEVCEGNVGTVYARMVGDDFYRYKWVKVGEEDREFPPSPLLRFPATTKKDEGFYYCIITDVNNDKTITTERAYMHVKELPKTAIVADMTEVCYGEKVHLSVEQDWLKPDVTYSYLWSGKGLENYTSETAVAEILEDADYEVVVSDGDCYIRDTVSVRMLRNELETPLYYSVEKGQGLKLWASVNGEKAAKLTWRIGEKFYRNLTDTLELAPASLQRSVEFEVTTEGQCTETKRGLIYVHEQTAYAGGADDGYVCPNNLPQILRQVGNLLGCDVDTAVMWVDVLECENLVYAWEKYSESTGWANLHPEKENPHFHGEETDTLVFDTIKGDDAGRYRCRVRNDFGISYSREVRLVKGGTPSLDNHPIVTEPVCENKSFTYSTDADIPHGGGKAETNLHWKWYFSRDNINFTQRKPEVDYDNESFTVQPCRESDEGWYMVEATNYCGSDSMVVFQEIWEKPRFTETPQEVYVCDKSELEVTTAVEGGGTYRYSLWHVNVDGRGRYVSDRRRLLNEGPDPSYKFDMIEDRDNGYYQWRVYNQCDSAYGPLFQIHVEMPIEPQFESVDTTMCAGVGNSLLMLANNNVKNPTPTLKYYWEKDGEKVPGVTANLYRINNLTTADAGVYICWAKHSCPEQQIKQYILRTKSRPQITLQPSLSEGGKFCEGATVSMQVDYTSDAGPVRCYWVHGNYEVTANEHFVGANDYKMTINGLVPSDGGNYYVKLGNDCPGVTSSNQVNLTVKQKARFTRTLPSSITRLCAGSNLTLSVSTSGWSPITYTWMKDDVPIVGERGASLRLTNVSHADSAKYSCYIQNECSGLEGEKTNTVVDIITPRVYNVEGAGGYCDEDFREITLSNFERGVQYTLKRRMHTNTSNYTTLKVVNGDTVSTEKLTFGMWGAGYYHVEATQRVDGVTCSAWMNGEVYLYQLATPQRFRFYVSSPMCTGERYGELTLAGTEAENVDYIIEKWNERYSDYLTYSLSTQGTGNPIEWRRVGKGTYRVRAMNRISGCVILMGVDTVTERPYAEKYDLIAERGDTTVCYGLGDNEKSDVVLALANRQQNVSYTLYKDGQTTNRTAQDAPRWDDVRGGARLASDESDSIAVYSVHAVTSYGCENDMGSVNVRALPQLQTFVMGGGGVYCQEDEGNDHNVFLMGSTPNVLYRLYSNRQSQELASTYGTGEYLGWTVPQTGDVTYSVVARDTHDMCTMTMPSVSRVEPNMLTITTTPDTVIVIDTRARLRLSIRNAMGTPTVTWMPASQLTPVEGTNDVMTPLLEKTGLYEVTVEDDYCSKSQMIQVGVEGDRLVPEIRAGDCFTSVDTIYICEDETINLCAVSSGGNGTYRYTWSDEHYTQGIPDYVNTNKSKLSYKRFDRNDGKIILEAVSSYRGVSMSQSDTVYVRTRKKPAINLATQNLTCVVPGTDTVVKLSDSENGVQYELRYRPKSVGGYTSRSTLTGDGSGLRFDVTNYNDGADAGFYNIKATKIYSEPTGVETRCEFTSGDFELRRQPVRSVISSGDFTEYCAGERRDTIYVASTEEGVTYQLKRGATEEGAKNVVADSKLGDGGRLMFEGAYGTGYYEVLATLDRCKDTMSGLVHIYSKPVPTINPGVSFWKEYCETERPVKAKIPVARIAGIQYAIYRDGETDPIWTEGTDGTSAFLEMEFDEEDIQIGSYYLVSNDLSVHCSDTLDSRLTIIETPKTLTLEKQNFFYCDGSDGLDGTAIIATGADPLIKYDLTYANQGAKLGTFTHGGGDTIRYSGTLKVAGNGTNMELDIYANAGSCSGSRGEVSVRVSVAPANCSLLGDSLGCVGIAKTMGLVATSSETGVTYSLYREGVAEALATQSGGGTIEFGSFSELGDYYIVARNKDGCTRVMENRYHIRPLPTFFDIYAHDPTLKYCEGSDGIQFGISGTQEGVDYFLQKWDEWSEQFRDVPGVIIEGKGGGNVLFVNYNKAGTYRVRSDYCNLPMHDTLTISELPLPELVRFSYEGKACIDSTMTLEITEPEPTATYTLFLNDAAAPGSTVFRGTDEVKWTITQAGAGKYSVLAGLNGCNRKLTEEYTTAESPQLGELQGILTTKCEGDTDTLYLNEWERDVTYVLHDAESDEEYKGKALVNRVIFPNVPAGHSYFIRANRESCTVEKHGYEYPSVPLPEMADDIISVIDCQENRISSVQLKGLRSDYQYTMAGTSGIYEIKAFAGDTLIKDVGNGEFTLAAYDPLTTCTSLSSTVTVRASIPMDTVVGRLAYCPNEQGVQVEISGQTYGVLYSLEDPETGEVFDQMSSSTMFNKYAPEGRYVFRSERVGLWGGCWTTDTFSIEKYPFPKEMLTVTLPDGTLCAAGANGITVENSEEDVYYMLKNSATGQYLDTIYGTGGAITFEGRKPAGTYIIDMAYKGLCRKNYWDNLVVSDVPPQAKVADCSYCQDVDVTETGCELYLSDLRNTAEYVLYDKKMDNHPLDTIVGVSAGYFKEMPSGDYYVVGTYVDTRCTDTVGEMSISRLTKPQVFSVSNANGGGNCATEVQITLNGYETDDVKYFLYMDGFYQVEGPVIPSASGVMFRKYKTPGNYSVFAVRGDNVCTNWMDGNVVLYDRPANAELSVRGYNCSGEASAQTVTITATNTQMDWNYFLRHGEEETVRQEGGPFIDLTWDAIGGHPLPSGEYVLYATNSCDSIIAMDTVSVYDADAPQPTSLVRYKKGYVCDEDAYNFDLTSNERGVTYTLCVADDTLEVIGEGNEGLMRMGSYVMTSAKQDVQLYATVDTSQCTYLVDTMVLRKDRTTEDPHVMGHDECVEEGGSITIVLSQPRVPRVDYYLKVNGHEVDTILSTASTSKLDFKPQTELGCYSIYATSVSRQCDAEYPARCMSLAPDTKAMDVSWNGELCEGESHPISVLNPQVGVKYYLVKDDLPLTTAAYGDGPSLVVANVSEAGNYKVMAWVTDACTAMATGEIDVKIMPKPELHVIHEYSYIKGGDGVTIEVKRPTSPGVAYMIETLDKYPDTEIFHGTANEYGDAVDLSDLEGGNPIYYKAGKYAVWTFSYGVGAFKCVAMDSILVKEEGVLNFDLEVVGTPYMCETGECRTLRLTGSEKGTRYELYRRALGESPDDEFVAALDGTGKVLNYGPQCDTGTYYVMAAKNIVDAETGETIRVEDKMGTEIRLYVTTLIEKYRLEPENDGYCYLDANGMPASPSGSVILSGSQSDEVIYQLYCNDLPVPGQSRTGTSGGKLRWGGLIGKNCEKNSDAGNHYRVVATDGKCSVDMAGDVSIIAVNSPQLIKQPYDVTVCTEERAVLGIQAYGCLLHYEWHNYDRTVHTREGDVQLAGGVVGKDASSFVVDTVTMNDMGKYTCTISNYCGIITTDTMTFSVREVVKLPAKMEDKMVCGSESGSVNLVSRAVGENYEWFRVGETEILGTTQRLEIKNATSDHDAGEYVCRTWNSCGDVYDTVRLDFNREPEVSGFVYHKDTLCVGSDYSITVASPDTLYWYKDDAMIAGKHDFTLAFDSITYENAGAYKIRAINACRAKEFNLVRLFVDDTLKPTVLPTASQHYCETSPIHLELAFEPMSDPNAASRIFTRWKILNAEDLASRNSLTFDMIPTVRDDGKSINLEYWNKCSSGEKKHNIYIDKQIHLGNFASDEVVSICTDPVALTDVIIHDDVQTMPSYNTYKWLRRNGTGKADSVGCSDTLKMPRFVSSTGDYYCEMSNSCGNLTSGDVKLHIDTMPTILRQPVADVTYCEGSDGQYVMMKARGGDLKYHWYAQRKGDHAPERVGYFEQAPVESEAKCTLEKLTYEFDSCRMWCNVENDCGIVTSDTIILRIDKRADLEVDKTLAYICPGGVAKIEVSITVPSITRWSYYVTGGGKTKEQHTVLGSTSDTLRLEAEGVYVIDDVTPFGTQCYVEDSRKDVNVVPQSRFSAAISSVGRAAICRGEKVQMRVQVTDGVGPWRLDIRRDGEEEPAPEFGSMPVEIWQRDTTFELDVRNSRTFVVASIVEFQNPNACDGVVDPDNKVAYTVQQPYGTRIGNVSDTLFGACKTVDLAKVLQPYPDTTIGKFYINGEKSSNNMLSGAPGRYEVKYRSETSAQCADSAMITLRIMPATQYTLTLDTTDMCHGDRTTLNLHLTGAGPFNYQIKTVSYDAKGATVGPKSGKRITGQTDGLYTSVIAYDEAFNGGEAKRTYNVARIVDKYGCVTIPNDPPLELNLHLSPTFRVAAIHSVATSGNEDDLTKEFIVPVNNKNVTFRIYIGDQAIKPWNSFVEWDRNDGSLGTSPKTGIGAQMRVFQSTEAGDYRFTVSDAYCPSRTTVIRKIVVLDTIFIRTKVLLEGAYRLDGSKMTDYLWTNNHVPMKTWSAWPTLSDGRKGVDWVTVELHEGGVNGKLASSAEFLLLDDGTVVDKTGSDALPMPGVEYEQKYYLVIRHRNHLSIGSAKTVELATSRSGAVLTDMRVLGNIFTQDNEDPLQHIAFLERVNGMYLIGMRVGDVLDNNLISAENTSDILWEVQSVPGYYKEDVDFDGVVTAPAPDSRDGKIYADPVGMERDDMSKVYNNRDKYSEIKE